MTTDTKAPTQTLREAFELHVSKSLTTASLRVYRQALARLDQFMGRSATLSDLTRKTIDGTSASMREAGMSRSTTKNFRTRILAIGGRLGLPLAAAKLQCRTAAGTLAELTALLDERLPTSEELWLFVNYFRRHGVKRPILAQRLGITYLYLNALLYGSKRVTEQFAWRLAKVLAEPIDTPAPPKARRPAKRKAAAKLPKAGRARYKLLPYAKLVKLLDKPELTAADLWPMVNYFASFGIKRPALAKLLGISFFHLVNVLYATKPVTERLRQRFKIVLAEPLTPAVPEPKQPVDLNRLPEPVRDGEPVPEPSGPTLTQHLARYRLERPLAESSIDNIEQAIRRYSHWLGRDATLGDLADRLVNRWLVSLVTEGVSRVMQKGLRSRILALWRHAHFSELVAAGPVRVRKIKLDRPLPEAWTAGQLRKLLAVAREETGVFKCSRVPKAPFWEAYILATYYTALRLGDMLSLRRDQVPEDGRFTVVQHKTGDGILCQILPDGLAAIEATFPPERELIFGGVIDRDYFLHEFRRLVRAAGLKGSSKWLRRSAATAIEKLHPGAATALLGHRSPDMARRHYIDPSQIQQDKPCPPPLEPIGIARVEEGGAQ